MCSRTIDSAELQFFNIEQEPRIEQCDDTIIIETTLAKVELLQVGREFDTVGEQLQAFVVKRPREPERARGKARLGEHAAQAQRLLSARKAFREDEV